MSAPAPTIPPRAFGWIPSNPQHPDSRRPLVALTPIAAPPPVVDLAPQMGPVLDQDGIGCCTAGSVASLVQHAHVHAGQPDWSPSLLFNYWFSRKRLNLQNADQGSTISCALASAVDEGICSQDGTQRPGVWLFDPAQVNVEPSADAIFAAKHHQATQYRGVLANVNAVLQVLASGWPVAFGITVYSSFYLAQSSGIIPMPQPQEQILGGHAMCFCGYDLPRQLLKVKNQWGDWGPNGGYLWLPFGYPFSDCWTIAKERS